jgi:hypothetical protein
MAAPARYTAQMPFVGTPTHKRLVERVAEEGSVSQAKVTRSALDVLFGTEDGDVPAGTTEDEIVARVIAFVRSPQRVALPAARPSVEAATGAA